MPIFFGGIDVTAPPANPAVDWATKRFIRLTNLELFGAHLVTEQRDEQVVLYHVGVPGLRRLDPMHFGRNAYSASELRASQKPRLFFFVAPDQRDLNVPLVGTLYQGRIAIGELYPLEQDPLAIKSSVMSKTSFINGYLEAIHQKGFQGVIYRQDRYIASSVIVSLFQGLEVQQVGSR